MRALRRAVALLLLALLATSSAPAGVLPPGSSGGFQQLIAASQRGELGAGVTVVGVSIERDRAVLELQLNPGADPSRVRAVLTERTLPVGAGSRWFLIALQPERGTPELAPRLAAALDRAFAESPFTRPTDQVQATGVATRERLLEEMPVDGRLWSRGAALGALGALLLLWLAGAAAALRARGAPSVPRAAPSEPRQDA